VRRSLRFFLRITYQLLYHQMAWTYDGVAAIVSLGRWQDWIKITLPYLPGPNILEIGHGPGHLQVAMTERGLNACGLDESRWMNRIALKRLRNTSTTPKILNGYAQSLPFASETFNQVVATFPPEFVTDPATLQEVQRTLVPGGCFIVLPFAWITGNAPADRLARGIFSLTDQAPPWDQRFLLPFRQAGFDTHYETVEIRNSVVALIRAFKVD
jgi:ubiquinone/menaquinone biosynthesis C-methylase UbiE